MVLTMLGALLEVPTPRPPRNARSAGRASGTSCRSMPRQSGQVLAKAVQDAVHVESHG